MIVGRELEVDCNLHWFGGSLAEQVVQGRGYTCYEITGLGGPASTLRACPGEPKQLRFVQALLGDPLLRYDSRLPLVVYVPDGFELRYRVWSAGEGVYEAPPE